jgi:hypothetical protein
MGIIPNSSISFFSLEVLFSWENNELVDKRFIDAMRKKKI